MKEGKGGRLIIITKQKLTGDRLSKLSREDDYETNKHVSQVKDLMTAGDPRKADFSAFAFFSIFP